MWTKPQKSLAARAWMIVCGVLGETDPPAAKAQILRGITGFEDITSTTDARLTDAHFDKWMAINEAYYWRLDQYDSPIGPLPDHRPVSGIFRADQRDYWRTKNSGPNTSRDRYTSSEVARQIHQAEAALQAVGKGPAYVAAIRRKIPEDRAYIAALRRTLQWHNSKAATVSPSAPSAKSAVPLPSHP